MRFSYPFLRRLGLGTHLAVVIVMAAIPTAFLVIQFIQAEQREAIEEAHDWAEDTADHVADHHRAEIASARDLLDASAAQLDSSGAPSECTVVAGANRTIWLVGGSDIAGSGDATCGPESGFPLPRSSVTSIVTQSFSTGFTVVGPLEASGGTMHMFGVLTRTTADGATWHIAKTVELSWLPEFRDELVAPADIVVMALDKSGRVFQRLGPDGSPGAGPGPRAHFNLADLGGVATTEVDGTKRIVGAAPVPDSDVTMLVGLSHEAVMETARQELFASLALFASVITLSGLLAWLLIERMVLRSVRQLRDAAVATANGAYDRRVTITDGPVELRELADAFNDMTSRLQQQALHDQLTGLANRRLLAQRLDELVDRKSAFAALAIDLDGFKPVNDTHGHEVGDRVLSAIAGRLKSAVSEDATIGRTGGDEFLALIPVDDPDGHKDKRAAAAAKALLYQIGQPIPLDGAGEVSIGGCIGIAYWPQDGDTAEDVVRQADVALYQAKKTGKNRYLVFKPAKASGGTQAA